MAEDILEEANAEVDKWYQSNTHQVPIHLVQRLIQEVERLRDEIEGLNVDEFGRKL